MHDYINWFYNIESCDLFGRFVVGVCECRLDSWSGGDLHGTSDESRIKYHLAKENRLAVFPVIRSQPCV
jgi:hypothetical protein